jgi:predicted transcriptional regulator
LQVPRVNVDIPEALKARVDRLRAVQRRSLRAVVELALERYLAAEEQKDRRDEAA